MLKFDDKKNYLFVKVCSDSYLSTQIDKNQLIICEGYCEEFFNSIEYGKYHQTQIKYLCEIDDKGKIIFKKDLFYELTKVDDSDKKSGQPIFYQKKKEKFNIFKKIFKNLF
jgi:ssDNA-binding Zn-finger/Zn-ribbon topoisomerase 1